VRPAPLEALHLCVRGALGCERLRVVATGLDARVASWIRTAEDAATADLLLGARLEIAFAGDGLDAAWLAALREGWAGGAVEVVETAEDALRSSSEPAARFEVYPRPVRPDGPPLWLPVADAEAARAAAANELNAIAADASAALAYAESARDVLGLELALDRGEASTAELESLAAAGLERVALRTSIELDPGAADSVLEQVEALGS
jgi:hypothetical protein